MTGAFDPDFSTMRLDNALAYRQPQSQPTAAKSRFAGGMYLRITRRMKALENANLFGFGNADAAVFHTDADEAFFSLSVQMDMLINFFPVSFLPTTSSR